MPNHRWSGWPGAHCLDCGCEDPVEIALADGDYDPYAGWVSDEARTKYNLAPCPEPGSNRCNPYTKPESS